MAPKCTRILRHKKSPTSSVSCTKVTRRERSTQTDDGQQFYQATEEDFEDEFEIICKTCRQVFPTFPKFLFHKRILYCEKVEEPGNSKKTLHKVVNMLHEKQLESPKYPLQVRLQQLPSSKVAVFQTRLRQQNAEGLMKSEVMDIHCILDKDEVILGLDGKVAGPIVTSKQPNCSECKMRFNTKKSLDAHIKYRHSRDQEVYFCPLGRKTFSTAWLVFRHLINDHKKSLNDVRKMRRLVHKSCKRKGLITATMDKATKKLSEENEWLDNGDADQHKCGNCGRTFGRKAALHCHTQMCLKRLAAWNLSSSKDKIIPIFPTTTRRSPPPPPAPKFNRRAQQSPQKSDLTNTDWNLFLDDYFVNDEPVIIKPPQVSPTQLVDIDEGKLQDLANEIKEMTVPVADILEIIGLPSFNCETTRCINNNNNTIICNEITENSRPVRQRVKSCKTDYVYDMQAAVKLNERRLKKKFNNSIS